VPATPHARAPPAPGVQILRMQRPQSHEEFWAPATFKS
jgi:hypothetical protein